MLLVPRPEGAQPFQLLPLTRTVGPDGGVFLVFPAGAATVRAATRTRDGEMTGVLELTDVAPVSVPHRIRARARLSGPLTAGPGPAEAGHTTLCLEVREAYVDDLWGAEPVAPEDFAAAVPDPLVEHEAELIQHLHAAHSAEVRTLGGLLGERSVVLSGAGGTAVPVGLDRFGLRVRFTGDRCFDARFDFPEPVRDVTGLRRAMLALFDAASR